MVITYSLPATAKVVDGRLWWCCHFEVLLIVAGWPWLRLTRVSILTAQAYEMTSHKGLQDFIHQ